MITRADLCRQVWSIAAPVTVWAVHFVLIYALLSAACAPRMLLDFGTLRIATVVLTIVAVVLALLPMRVARGQQTDLSRSIWWIAIISTAAILFQTLPVLLWRSCG